VSPDARSPVIQFLRWKDPTVFERPTAEVDEESHAIACRSKVGYHLTHLVVGQLVPQGLRFYDDTFNVMIDVEQSNEPAVQFNLHDLFFLVRQTSEVHLRSQSTLVDPLL
jgi:hypothetical protein